MMDGLRHKSQSNKKIEVHSVFTITDWEADFILKSLMSKSGRKQFEKLSAVLTWDQVDKGNSKKKNV